MLGWPFWITHSYAKEFEGVCFFSWQSWSHCWFLQGLWLEKSLEVAWGSGKTSGFSEMQAHEDYQIAIYFIHDLETWSEIN